MVFAAVHNYVTSMSHVSHVIFYHVHKFEILSFFYGVFMNILWPFLCGFQEMRVIPVTCSVVSETKNFAMIPLLFFDELSQDSF